MIKDSLSGLRVLLVEDEILVAMYVEDLLEEAGCRIVGPVPRLDQALSTVADTALDVAILDVNLNGEHVWPVADALRARGVPHVFLTGYTGDTIPAVHAATRRLSKPIKAADLYETLHAVAASA